MRLAVGAGGGVLGALLLCVVDGEQTPRWSHHWFLCVACLVVLLLLYNALLLLLCWEAVKRNGSPSPNSKPSKHRTRRIGCITEHQAMCSIHVPEPSWILFQRQLTFEQNVSSRIFDWFSSGTWHVCCVGASVVHKERDQILLLSTTARTHTSYNYCLPPQKRTSASTYTYHKWIQRWKLLIHLRVFVCVLVRFLRLQCPKWCSSSRGQQTNLRFFGCAKQGQTIWRLAPRH